MNGLLQERVESAPSTDGIGRRPKRILVINDSPEILDLFRDILEAEGFEVTLFTFDPKHLAEIERQQPDLIILDYMIGGEPLGWQFLQMLKMTRATEHIPVIICTAAVAQIQQLSGHLHSTGVGVVLKPFNIDDLHQEVERHWAGLADQASRSVGIEPNAPEPTA